MRTLQVGADMAVGLLEVEGAPSGDSQWNLHPALVDSAFHLLGAVMLLQSHSNDRVYVPLGIDEVLLVGRAPSRAWACARLRESQPGSPLRIADLRLEDDSGNLIAMLTGLRIQEVSTEVARARGRCGLQRCADVRGFLETRYGR